jgi:preprotein translocase subunit SecE
MGRLLRKKKSKKRKLDVESGESLIDKGAEGGETGVPVASSSADVPQKRPPVQLQKKILPVPQKETFWHKGIQFLREVKAELKKVTWPSRQQALGSTVVVIVLVMIISFFLGIVDMGLSGLIRMVLP